MHGARKKEPELLGYDEEPIKVEPDICEQIKSLQICKERDANISFQNTEVSIGGTCKTSNQRTGDMKSFKDDVNNERNNQLKVAMHNGCLPKGTQQNNKKEYHGSAKSHKLVLLCTAIVSIKKLVETRKLSTLTSLTW